MPKTIEQKCKMMVNVLNNLLETMPTSFRFVNFRPVVSLEIIQSVPDYGVISRIIVNEPHPFFRSRMELAIESSSNSKFWPFVE